MANFFDPSLFIVGPPSQVWTKSKFRSFLPKLQQNPKIPVFQFAFISFSASFCASHMPYSSPLYLTFCNALFHLIILLLRLLHCLFHLFINFLRLFMTDSKAIPTTLSASKIASPSTYFYLPLNFQIPITFDSIFLYQNSQRQWIALIKGYKNKYKHAYIFLMKNNKVIMT